MVRWIYRNDHCNSVRYVLGIEGQNPLICFGINPSTANPDNLDRTLKTVERIAFSNGFDSWIMLNIYPQRATNPVNIHESLDTGIHKRNLEFINDILSERNQATIWAAWGTLIEERPFLINCLNDIYSLTLHHKCNWVTIGQKTKKGHPHHPLYLKSDARMEMFDIQEYLDSIYSNFKKI